MIAAGGVTEAVSPAAVLVVGSNERTLVAKKPKGWNAFNKLAKRIVAVPKSKVDEAIAEAEYGSFRITESGLRVLAELEGKQ